MLGEYMYFEETECAMTMRISEYKYKLNNLRSKGSDVKEHCSLYTWPFQVWKYTQDGKKQTLKKIIKTEILLHPIFFCISWYNQNLYMQMLTMKIPYKIAYFN